MNSFNTLEEDIAHKMSMQMQSEIDREVLWGMLKSIGWTRVMIDQYTDNYHAVDISQWLNKHCTGVYERSGRDYIFENEKDAAIFILKWA
jgi:hypothetical protein